MVAHVNPDHINPLAPVTLLTGIFQHGKPAVQLLQRASLFIHQLPQPGVFILQLGHPLTQGHRVVLPIVAINIARLAFAAIRLATGAVAALVSKLQQRPPHPPRDLP